MVEAQGEAITTLTHKSGGYVAKETETVEKVGDPKLYDQPVCHVRVGGSITRNLGDFNSAKLEVHLEVPCLPNEIDGVYDYATEWVSTRIQAAEESLGAGMPEVPESIG